MGIARVLLKCWEYKVKDYQNFKKAIRTIKARKWDPKFLRNLRMEKANRERLNFEKSVHQAWWDRVKYLRMKKASLVIQKSYVITQFKKLVRGRMAVRSLVYEEFNTRFWDAIILVIQARSSLVIQNIFRGYLTRTTYSYQVTQFEEFKRNYKRIKAASRLIGFFRANYVRQKIKKLVKASVVIQKNLRMKRTRLAFVTVKQATLKIQVDFCDHQGFLRKCRFKKNRYDFLLEEKLDSGEFVRREDLAIKELAGIFSINFVNSVKPSDRLNKLNKKSCNMSFVPGKRSLRRREAIHVEETESVQLHH